MATLKHRAYVSQGTQGVAIDWTSNNPDAPDFSAPVTAACPSTLPAGVTACTVEASGTVYTFALNIPAGTYANFTVSSFGTAPSASGTFTGQPLDQGQIAGPLTITASGTQTIPALTFYGVPASVSFVPAPSQPHVVPQTISSVAAYGVIGAQPQTFFVQSYDAEGFAISSSDPGAPTLTVAERAADSPQQFTVASTANPYAYTLQAIASSGNSTAATIVVTATPGGSGLTTVSQSFPVLALQEVWTVQETLSGSGAGGIYGYALNASGTLAASPIDSYYDAVANPLCQLPTLSCTFTYAAVDPTSGIIFAGGQLYDYAVNLPAIYAFTPGASGNGLVADGAVNQGPIDVSVYQSFATDSNHHFFMSENEPPQYLDAFTISGTALTNEAQYSESTAAFAIAVAPTAPNVPAALVNSLWTSTASGLQIFPPYTSGLTPSATISTCCGNAFPLGFDTNGYLWVVTSPAITVYTVSGTPASPSITQVGSGTLISPGYEGESFGAAAPSSMWMGEGVGEPLLDRYTLSSSTCTPAAPCTIGSSHVLSQGPGFAGVFVTP